MKRDEAFVRRYGGWAVVTGASDGIGREFARELAARGFDLVLVARRSEMLQALAQSLQAAHGVECRVMALDLSDMNAVRAMLAATDELDVGLIVAAAGYGTSGPLTEGSLAAETEMVDLNCTAVLAQAWHFARRFAAQERGGIVLMSSLLAFQGAAASANYAATKAYVQTLSEGLREELRSSGVSVIASAPGPIATGFAARARMQMPQALQPRVVATQTLAALGRRGTVRPGWLSKLLGWSLATAPRALRVKIMGKVMSGMTAHQRKSPGQQGRTPA